MGSILGGGGSGGGGGGLGGLLDPLGLFKGGGGGGGLGGLLGNLPDPLHLFNKDQPQTPMGQQAQQGAPGQGPVNFAPQPGQGSGVSFNPTPMLYSPMGPGGFKVGGG